MNGSTQRVSWVVVFEARPDPARMDEYLAFAGMLRSTLESMPDFLENERFRSILRPGILLSLSLWKSEDAIAHWRTIERHRLAQRAGRAGIFLDYHIRVGICISDTMIGKVTSSNEARFLTIREVAASDNTALPKKSATLMPNAGPVTYDVFQHLTNPDRKLVLTAWKEERMAGRYLASRHVDEPASRGGLLIRVVRDYGMQDRKEAPQ